MYFVSVERCCSGVVDCVHCGDKCGAGVSRCISVGKSNSTNELWNRNEMIIDDIFAFLVATEIIKDDDIEPCSINECTQRQD